MKTSDNQSCAKTELHRRAEALFAEREGCLPNDFESLTTVEIRQIIHELLVSQVELEMQNQELLRVQADQEAKQTRYRELYDFAPVGYITISEKGIILDANLTAAKQLGRPRDALIKQAFSLFIYKADRESFNAYQKKLFEFSQPQVWEQRMLRQDNTIFWAQLEATALKSGLTRSEHYNGGYPVCPVVLTDITERKRAEEKLRESEERFRLLAMSSSDGVLIADEKGTILFWNKAAENMTGYSKEEVMAKSIHILSPKPYPDIYNQNQGKMINAGNSDYFVKYVKSSLLKKDGTEIPVEVSTACWKEGNCSMIGCFIKNLTVKKQQEKHKLMNRKIDALQVFSGWLSHDLNNLQSVAIGNIELALEQNKDKVVRGYLTDAFAAGLSTKALIQTLMRISQSSSHCKKPVSLPDLISMNIKKANADEHIHLCFDPCEDIPHVQADEELLEIVIKTVIENAVEAMPDGGDLKIMLENIFLVDANKTIGCMMKDGEYVKASFKDSGTGISKHNLEKVFDPCFSTKERGAENGKGLSLTLAYSILRLHNGHIEINSSEGEGTEINIWLPVLKEAVEGQNSKSMVAAAHESYRRVLVLEEDKLLRDMIGQKLENMGIGHDLVSRGQDAVDIYSRAVEKGRPFGLVILDLTVNAGIGGVEALVWIKKKYPLVRAVIMSGYSEDPVITNYQRYGFIGALVKPFELKDFEKLVKKGLGIAELFN